jgi:lipopolysaccharide/colanic/teichoic acid biosynthesis glycosyltransferase
MAVTHTRIIQMRKLGLDPVKRRAVEKRAFDITLAAVGLLALSWLIAILWVVAAIETRGNGFFMQHRVGRFGQTFKILKIKTMFDHSRAAARCPVAIVNTNCITRSGRFMRRYKLDELPQLWNIVRGEMSFVGPRPDVPGFADCLEGEERAILALRPGVTGPASLRFRNEEEEFANVQDPVAYNRNVVWPEKIRLNLAYLKKNDMWTDLYIIWRSCIPCRTSLNEQADKAG